jgi:hypothetical protein
MAQELVRVAIGTVGDVELLERLQPRRVCGIRVKKESIDASLASTRTATWSAPPRVWIALVGTPLPSEALDAFDVQRTVLRPPVPTGYPAAHGPALAPQLAVARSGGQVDAPPRRM